MITSTKELPSHETSLERLMTTDVEMSSSPMMSYSPEMLSSYSSTDVDVEPLRKLVAPYNTEHSTHMLCCWQLLLCHADFLHVSVRRKILVGSLQFLPGTDWT